MNILLGSTLAPAAMNAIGAFATTHVLPEPAQRDAFLANVAASIDCVVWPPFIGSLPPALVEKLPALGLIATMGAGYETIDVAHAAGRGIHVSNTPRAVTADTADTAFYLVLAAVRRFPAAERVLRAGGWTGKPPERTPSLHGKTLGVVGYGRIGKAVAHRAQAFGLKIVYYARSRKPDVAHPWFGSIAETARNCDILVSVLPGGDATRGLIGKAVFDALGPAGVFVNIGRGTSVDEPALVDALKSGVIAGAGLDVFANEPDVPADLIAMENVVLLPHVGGATDNVIDGLGRDLVENLRAFGKGEEPPDLVAETPWKGRSARG